MGGIKVELRSILNESTNTMGNRSLESVRMTMIEFPMFGAEDVRGWMYRCEQFYIVDTLHMAHKLQLGSIHLFDIASMWHRQFIKIMGEICAMQHL